MQDLASAKATHTRVLDASADAVWSALRTMDDIDHYSSFIGRVEWNGAKGIGGQRVCYTPDGKGCFKETIVAFDDATRTYAYSLDEGAPVQGTVNTFTVVDLGYQKSKIVWTSTYDAFIENPDMTEAEYLAFVNNAITELVDNVAQAATKASM